jgi:deoxyribonuclease V
VRGGSRRPLFVSAVAMSAEEAAAGIRAMHGRHRIPTLLQFVDHAARAALV